MTASTSTVSPAPKAFGALALRGYRAYLLTFMLTMMADNVEHVISYWVVFQKFHSPALGGFAVVSHWLPFLAFSVAIGALNDRFDSRRLIQGGAVLFMIASAGWGYFFITDTLQMWHAMVLLVIHGCAGVLWVTSSQMLLYDIVGPASLPSAVRLAATARYLGVLVGPGVGSVVMLTLGPTRGIFFNTVFYLPLFFWLISAPYGRHFRGDTSGPKRAVRGLADIVQTIREVRTIPLLATMILLAGGASFFIGNSYQAQMPGFANDLGHGDPGTAYTMLLAADAAGALLAGILLESRGGIFKMSPPTAVILAMGWAAALFGFALMRVYPLAIALLFLAGFFELSFSSMTQTLVQMHAPETTRGRVLGLYNMAAAGLRAFSGITVGLVGSLASVHTSLAVAAGAFVSVSAILLARLRTASSVT
ncbi:MFS transporter [Pendulispora brunnea]|uniref:MFS transporter n=1 Tax=Pendulispora brunnea TaxID=2905690 RepID=A0ABZ2K648_9BACT